MSSTDEVPLTGKVPGRCEVLGEYLSNEWTDDKGTKYKHRPHSTLLSQQMQNLLRTASCLKSFPLPAFLNWKAWNPAAYHGIGEEEDGIQGPEEKSGFLCTGKQTAAAPELRGHNGNTSTPLLPASVPYFSRPLKRDLLFPLNFSTDGARAVVDETLCLGRDQGYYTKQHC